MTINIKLAETGPTALIERAFCDHAMAFSRKAQYIVRNGFLAKDGYGRWASYWLGERLTRSGHNAERTPKTTTESSQRTDAYRANPTWTGK